MRLRNVGGVGMACEFLYNEVQAVSLNAPVLLNASIPCTRGNVIHENGTGNFILRGSANNCNSFARYQVTFNANIAIPEGGDVTPIAVALTVNGEPRLTSRAIYSRLPKPSCAKGWHRASSVYPPERRRRTRSL